MADRHQSRWPFIAIPYSVSCLCFIGLISIPHPKLPGLTYAFLFGIPAGVYPPLIGVLSWVGNNLAPSWKRAVGMALLISIGNMGGAIGSNIFLVAEKPRYWLGYGMGLSLTFAAVVSTFILRFAYGHANKKRDQMSEEEIRAKYTEEEMLGKFSDAQHRTYLPILQIWETGVLFTDMSFELNDVERGS